MQEGARRVVVFSRGEAKQAAMKAQIADERVRYLIGDVRDRARLVAACRHVDIVVHAAALKRVEVCESDPDEAVLTNIVGTQNVVHACIANGVQGSVFLSTDKASSPNTLYGFTKATAERLWIASNAYSAGLATQFSATRYGNVLGSTGSVIPTWRAQACGSNTITITEPAATRFWMTMGQAVDLVVLALSEMRGGEVFVPKIPASTIGTLAEAVVPFATWNTVGLRPGEKLHEMLISNDEARHTHDAGSHFVIEPESRSWGDAAPLRARKVPEDFSLTSYTSNWLTVEELKAMVAT